MIVSSVRSFTDNLPPRLRGGSTDPGLDPGEGKGAAWLASLAAAAALNLLFLWLATIAPSGPSVPALSPSKRAAVEIVQLRRVPPPPNLDAAEDPPLIVPPRAKRVWGKYPRSGEWGASFPLSASGPPLRLRLNLNPCDPDEEDSTRKLECAPPQEWLRADRDASKWLGPETQGLTMDEIAATRGWIKPKPRSGQDAMAAQTDSTLPQSVFKDAPFPPDAIERSGGW